MKVRNLGFLGYPDYEVDDQGNVWSLNFNKTGERRKLKPAPDKNGYLNVMLYSNGKGKMFKIHQLVLRAFNDWSMWFDQINHRDENKKNNNLTNLEWCDCRYNLNYGTRIERISKPILGINIKTGDVVEFIGLSDAAQALNIGIGHIWECCQGRRKSAGNFIWKYKDIFT